MANRITNFARFYSLLAKAPGVKDRDALKRSLVMQFTHDRTDSLREMTLSEYEACCRELERNIVRREDLRRERSVCLHLMQSLGVNTSVWDRVNAFCQDSRIAGKRFGSLNLEELEQLARKLRGIKRKGGLRPAKPKEAAMRSQQTEPDIQVMVISLTDMGQA